MSAFINALFVTAVTIGGELNEPFKEWLKSLSGHHWTSKSVISAALYLTTLILFYVIFQNVNSKKVREAILLAVLSAAAGSLTILTFFAGHHFGWF